MLERNSLRSLLTGIILLSFMRLSAQEPLVPTKLPPQCATDEVYNEAIQRDPSLRVRQEQIDRAYQETVMRLAQNSVNERGVTVYTIPVVVHVMHLPGTPVGKDENITAAVVKAGVQHMTEAFRKQQTEYNGVGHNNNIAGVDVEFEFALAKRDPSGNPTDGINRVATTYSNLDRALSSADLAMKALSRWDQTKYLNVWLVKEICYFSTTGDCGVAGYSTFASSHGNLNDGFVNEAAFWGSSRNNSKVHIHEAGHYFNLYHTFQNGCTNANCLTDGDQVCDTPPDNSTSSVNTFAPGTSSGVNSCTTDATDITAQNPYRPIANGGIGDQEDLFEDYMDYGSQSTQTTYTAGQKVRMVAALTGTRASLINAATNMALVSTTISALASFGDDGAYANEATATTSTDCRTYIDVNVPIQLYNAPTSAVTVNITVNAVSTAAVGSDFALQTTSVIIAAGATTGNIVMRIFNDKTVESNETIVLNISSTTGNSGNTGIAVFNTSYTYTIIDNDVAPSGSNTVLVSTDFSTVTGIGNNVTNTWISSAFNAFSNNRFVIGANGGTCTTGNSLYVTNNTTTKPNAYDDIVSQPLFYRSIDATGYSGLTVSYDYKIGGIASADVGKLYIRAPSGSGSFSGVSGATNINNISCTTASLALNATLNNSIFDFCFNFSTIASNGNPAPTFTIDNFQVVAAPTPIATATTATATAYLGANATVYFITTTGELLAKIENLSTHDYGCTTIAVDRAGTSSITNAGQTYKYSSKTFTVTPTTNTSTGSYKITLYYTAAERNGWVSASGGYNATDIKVVKSSGVIASATDAGTSYAYTAPISFGSNYGYEAQYTTALGGFSIGASPTSLAVNLLSFTAKKFDKAVNLDWSTSVEKDHDYFRIEKSLDGKNFSTLSQVKGRNTGVKNQQYQLFDNNPSNGVNYYRLTSVDLAGIETHAQIVSVNFVEKTSLTIHPNPSSRSNITLNYRVEAKDNIVIEWIDMMGHIRKESHETVAQGDNPLNMDISDLSSGVYLVRTYREKQPTDVSIIRFVKL